MAKSGLVTVTSLVPLLWLLLVMVTVTDNSIAARPAHRVHGDPGARERHRRVRPGAGHEVRAVHRDDLAGRALWQAAGAQRRDRGRRVPTANVDVAVPPSLFVTVNARATPLVAEPSTVMFAGEVVASLNVSESDRDPRTRHRRPPSKPPVTNPVPTIATFLLVVPCPRLFGVNVLIVGAAFTVNVPPVLVPPSPFVTVHDMHTGARSNGSTVMSHEMWVGSMSAAEFTVTPGRGHGRRPSSGPSVNRFPVTMTVCAVAPRPSAAGLNQGDRRLRVHRERRRRRRTITVGDGHGPATDGGRPAHGDAQRELGSADEGGRVDGDAPCPRRRPRAARR